MGILYYDNLGRRWCYKDLRQDGLEEIIVIPGTMLKQKKEFLAEHYMAHRKDFRVLDKAIDYAIGEPEVDTDPDIDLFTNLHQSDPPYSHWSSTIYINPGTCAAWTFSFKYGGQQYGDDHRRHGLHLQQR